MFWGTKPPLVGSVVYAWISYWSWWKHGRKHGKTMKTRGPQMEFVWNKQLEQRTYLEHRYSGYGSYIFCIFKHQDHIWHSFYRYGSKDLFVMNRNALEVEVRQPEHYTRWPGSCSLWFLEIWPVQKALELPFRWVFYLEDRAPGIVSIWKGSNPTPDL